MQQLQVQQQQLIQQIQLQQRQYLLAQGLMGLPQMHAAAAAAHQGREGGDDKVVQELGYCRETSKEGFLLEMLMSALV